MMDICGTYERKLQDEQISPPLAAILSLSELCATSNAGTMFELVKALNEGADSLRRNSSNPISLNAGCELFIAFVTLFPHDSVPSSSFSDLKMELVKQGETYVRQALTYRTKIAELGVDFIQDSVVRTLRSVPDFNCEIFLEILTHSYSRVVMETLLLAHRRGKRISVFVTEARPRGLGVKTADALTAAGIPCTVILDSAVAYAMEKVDFAMVGSEAVVESGGLINAIGSLNIAIIARASNVPFYALAESYKFHRLFPLSQYDLPSHNPRILSFPTPIETDRTAKKLPSSVSPNSRSTLSSSITQEEIAKNNPDVDYTRPDLISLVFSDVGSLTPSGVSQYLVGMFH
ncbi:nagb/rpia/CoA transferase-like protein [Mycena galopus ATCC 62051]|nr:nagb/rpia/CoA transferase-like protein [Mycena galopus ATCC 62051]